MKAILILLPVLAASGAEIPSNTHVLLKMVNSINTRTAAEGDQVYLQTASPITVGGAILVPAGSYVQGAVTHTKRSGKVAGRAELVGGQQAHDRREVRFGRPAQRHPRRTQGQDGQHIHEPSLRPAGHEYSGPL